MSAIDPDFAPIRRLDSNRYGFDGKHRSFVFPFPEDLVGVIKSLSLWKRLEGEYISESTDRMIANFIECFDANGRIRARAMVFAAKGERVEYYWEPRKEGLKVVVWRKEDE